MPIEKDRRSEEEMVNLKQKVSSTRVGKNYSNSLRVLLKYYSNSSGVRGSPTVTPIGLHCKRCNAGIFCLRNYGRTAGLKHVTDQG